MPGFAKAGVWGPINFSNSQGLEYLGTLTVYTDSARTIKATLYTDQTAATAAPNPVSPDTLGNFTVYAAPGLYYGTFTHGGTSSSTLLPVVPMGSANPVLNVLDYGAKGDGVTDDTTAIQAAATAAAVSGGTVSYPPGTFLVSSPITLASNVSHVGAGKDVSVIKAAASLTTQMFAATLTAGQTIKQVTISGLTLNGNALPSGTLHLVHLDTTANNNIIYTGIVVSDCFFQNAQIGFYHAGNNANGTVLPRNWSLVTRCDFDNLSVGWCVGGTFGSSCDLSHFSNCTGLAAGTPSIVPGLGLTPGTGPTAYASITNCHVEGKGVLSSLQITGTGTEYGLAISSTGGRISSCILENISQAGILANSTEGTGVVLSNIIIWGCGLNAFVLGGGSTDETGVVENFVVQNVGNGSVPNSGSAANQSAVFISNGSWTVCNGTVSVAGTTFGAPNWAFTLAGNNNTLGRLRIDSVACNAFNTAFYNLLFSTQSSLNFRITNCPGYNPVGVVSPGVPGSGSPVAAVPYDRTFYVSTVAGTTTCSMAIQNGPTVPFIASTAQVVAVRVPAWQTVTPTYTGTPPTWVVEGE